jgi:CMP-N-acetylneuraminic acid synthetase
MLAIIPARGGSKGLPKKNIRPMAGEPLIAHSIKAALQAKSITELPGLQRRTVLLSRF